MMEAENKNILAENCVRGSIMNKIQGLPEPDCITGYTDTQVREITGTKYIVFLEWMRGQTMAFCDGRVYDHDKKDYVISCDVEHGMIVYSRDIKAYLLNQGIDD